MTDLSVVVTVRDETVVCGPTIRAAEASIELARRHGHTVQPIIALAGPTEATTRYVAQPRLAGWKVRTYDDSEPAHVRNGVVGDADGRLLAFVPAGDLVGETWLSAAVARLQQAEHAGERAIAHPELSIRFDGVSSAVVNLDTASPLGVPQHLFVGPGDGAPCLAPREAHLETPYLAAGDPDTLERRFLVASTGRGWIPVVVPDTVVFRRVRELGRRAPNGG